MPRFILIDNWLESVGGHNYQYAVEILEAATHSGYQPILATAKSFKQASNGIPTNWRCYPLFRYAWNRTHTVGVDGKRTEPIDLGGRPLPENITSNEEGYLTRFKQWPRSLRVWDRRRRIRSFAGACQQLFDQLGFESEDIVFFPSVSDFDFVGLAAFLASNQETQKIHWHVQFHYDIFDGRPPDFQHQHHRKQYMQRQFSHALTAVDTHHLHFYATTPQIADQYNRLGVGSFCALPYPISSGFSEPTHKAATSHKPLRVTLAGAPRREKGKRQLNCLFSELCKANILGGDLQLWIQGNIRKIARQLTEFDKNHLAAAEPDMQSEAKVVVASHPLKRQKYLALIERTDIGLLPYNNARYHARASGVFIEMLSAAVPVIVTAGSWMALQLAEPTYQYLDQVFAEHTSTSKHAIWKSSSISENKLSVIDQGDENTPIRLAGDSQPASHSVDVPQGTDYLMIRFTWREKRPGYFVRIRIFQSDKTGQKLGAAKETILSPREEGKTVSALIPINPQAQHLRIDLSNAYHDDMIEAGIPQISFMKQGEDPIPLGTIGLIASDLNQIPDLLQEMVLHHVHYKTSAIKYAETWNFKHSPLRTLEILTKHQTSQRVPQEAA